MDMVVQSITLDESMLDKDVPCTTTMVATGKLCGMPSIVRVLVVCPEGIRRRHFYCKECYYDLVNDQIGCAKCLGVVWLVA
jgi:hypothetical protein